MAVARIAPTGGREWALDRLATLVDLYDRGMREPLPLACLASAAYASAAAVGGDAIGAAAKEWESSFGRDREDKEPDHQLVLGGVRTFAELVGRAPDFGAYAERLWAGPLRHEQVADR